MCTHKNNHKHIDGIKQILSNKTSAYRWFNDLIKCVVGVFCADPHFNARLGHVLLQVISDSVVAFQLHTEGPDTGGVQVHLQFLRDSVCVEKKPGRCGDVGEGKLVVHKRSLYMKNNYPFLRITRFDPLWAVCRSRRTDYTGCHCHAYWTALKLRKNTHTHHRTLSAVEAACTFM